MSSRLLNEVNEIRKMMGLLNESEKSVEFLDLDKLEKNGGVEVYDGDGNKVLDNFELKHENELWLNIKNRLFDNDEVLEIDIDGLIPEKVDTMSEITGRCRHWNREKLDFFNYVDDRYLIKLPLSLLKKNCDNLLYRGVPIHKVVLVVKGNIDSPSRELYIVVDLSKARIKSKEE